MADREDCVPFLRLKSPRSSLLNETNETNETDQSQRSALMKHIRVFVRCPITAQRR